MGNRKEIKKEKIEKTKINTLDQKRKKRRRGDKRKNKAMEAWQIYCEEGEEGTEEEEERREKGVMNTIKKHTSSGPHNNRKIHQKKARSPKRKGGRGNIYNRRLHNIRHKWGTIYRKTTKGDFQRERESRETALKKEDGYR